MLTTESEFIHANFCDSSSADFARDKDGRFLVYGDSGEISIFSPGTECRKIKYRGFILMPRLSPDGTRYLNVRSDNHTKQSLRLAFVTNVETGADLFALPPAQDPITDIAWSPRGDTLATLEAGTVRVWNADSGRFLFELKPGEVRRMRYTPDGKLIYTTGQDGVLQFWEVSNGTLQCSLRDGLNKVLVAAMSPDGNLLATGGVDGKICVWNVRSLLFKLHILRMPEFWMSVLLATLFFLSVCSDRRLFKNSQRFRVFGVI
ncbi:MAG TPA: hypothetical protein VKX17_08695 [Planctomycetota bacterium]|nr:hypothetical protein [Planctomycetota bacterium]